MIFQTEQPIDENLKELARRFRSLVKDNLYAKWIPERDHWIITSYTYLSKPVYVSYHWIDKNKYEVYIQDEIIGSFNTPKNAIDSIMFLNFMEKGVSKKIIEYIAKQMRLGWTIQKTVDSIALETNLFVTVNEMEILRIDPEQLGTIVGMSFGI